jgi:FixJ family two-component response regulator
MFSPASRESQPLSTTSFLSLQATEQYSPVFRAPRLPIANLEDQVAILEAKRARGDRTPVVSVVCDDLQLRGSISQSLCSRGYDLVWYGSILQLLRDGRSLGPACLILATCEPALIVSDFYEVLSNGTDSLSVIVVSDHPDIEAAVAAMKAGVIDFLVKPVTDLQLNAAIERGLVISKHAFARREQVKKDQRAFMSLSPREQDVCLRVVQGMLNKQVAFDLGTTEKTVKAQRSKVMQKLEANSLPDVVRLVERLRSAGALFTSSSHCPHRHSSGARRSECQSSTTIV